MLLHICTFLDPRYKSLQFLSGIQRERITEQVLELISLDSRECEERPAETERASASFLSDVFTSDDRPQGTSPEEELRRYISVQSTGLMNSPLLWWKGNESVYPRLAQIAAERLVIQATSVASERLFSAAGLLVSNRRSSLDPKNVNMLLFLNKNTW